MYDSDGQGLDVEAFEDLFTLDVRVEAMGVPVGSCNMTNDGCSNSCASVGCSKTCRNCK